MPLLRGLLIVLLLAGVSYSQTASQEKASSSDKPASTGTTASSDSAPSWPRFHGPRNDNISTETGLLKEWPKDGPELAWKATDIGEGYAGVVVGDGRIFTAGNRDGKSTVTAFDLDGNLLWQKDNGEGWTTNYPGGRSTPTLDGDRLYDESAHCLVTCFKAATGEKLWSVNVLKEFEAKNITWSLAESLLIDGDNVICCPFGKKGSVVALNKMTGKTAWAAKATNDLAGYATPTLITHAGLRIILTMNQKALVGVNADDGELLFRHEHVTRYDVNATTPIFHDGQIFITSGYGTGSVMLKLNVDGRKASVEKLWSAPELDNHHGGVVLLNGYLYGAAHEAKKPDAGKWLCLDWKTGKKQYSEKGVGKGSLTSADGMLYTVSEQRQVGLAVAAPDGLKVVSQFKLPSGGGGPSWAHPVVCGGRLYIRHSNTLFAYKIR